MKKIKKFKINFRPRSILKLLKSAASISEVTPQLEDAVNREAERLAGVIVPAAIYETLPKEKVPLEFQAGAPAKWVAASFYTVTLGRNVEEENELARVRGDSIHQHIPHAVFMEALDQSGDFIGRLIAEEAKGETCDMTAPVPVIADAAWAKLAEMLPGDKIGVKYLTPNKFDPLYSASGIIYWFPLSKKK